MTKNSELDRRATTMEERNMLSFQNFPLVIVMALVVMGWLSFLSVVLS